MNKRSLIDALVIIGFFAAGCTPAPESRQENPIISTSPYPSMTQALDPTSTSEPILTRSEAVLQTLTPIAETEVKSTLANNPAPTATQSVQKDVIYVFDRYDTGAYFYAYPEPLRESVYLESEQILVSPGPDNPEIRNLGFANFAPNMAYFDGQNNVWLANLHNDSPTKIFTSEDPLDLENQALFRVDTRQIIWTPDDKHIIMDFNSENVLNMIFHIDTGQLEEWDYVCDRLAISPRTQVVAIWCLPSDIQDRLAVIEWGGEIWYSDKHPGEVLIVSNPGQEIDDSRVMPLYGYVGWASDGSRLAYYDPDDDSGGLQIVSAAGEIRKRIPEKAYWLAGLFNSPGKPVNWAKSGDRLLVFAIGEPGNPCPTIHIEAGSLQGEYPNAGCWQVYDPETGRRVWTSANLWPSNSRFGAGINFNPKPGPAAISADGKMVAVFVYGFGYEPFFFVVDILNDRILQDAPFTVEELKWGKLP